MTAEGGIPEAIPKLFREQLQEKRVDEYKKMNDRLNDEIRRLKAQLANLSDESVFFQFYF